MFYFMSSATKLVPGDLLLIDITMKTTTYNCQTIPRICIHTLRYKIKSLTLLKQIKFTKQTGAKLTWQSGVIGIGNA